MKIAFKRLEPCAGKLACTVPRGANYSNVVRLLDQNSARALNQNPTQFINTLKNVYLFYQGSALVPYQRYRDQGLFIVKSSIVYNIVRYKTYITPKGLEYFAE